MAAATRLIQLVAVVFVFCSIYGRCGLVNTMRHAIFVVTAKTFDTLVENYRSAGVASVAYYDTNDAQSEKFITGAYNDLAEDLRGMAKIAAVDCTEWGDFCKQQNVEKLPTVIIYPPHPYPSMVYEGQMDQKSMAAAITRHIPGENVVLYGGGEEGKKQMDKFLTTSVAVPKVMLFSEKKTVPTLFKALSNAFHDRMSFAFVSKEAEETASRFAITKWPTLLVVTGAATADNKGEKYDGEMKFSALHEWLNVRSETFVKGGGYSSHEAVEEEKPWLAQEIPEITRPSHQDVCFRHNALCVIYASKGGEPSADATAMLTKLQKEYKSKESERTAKFMFSWFDPEIEVGLAEVLGLSDAASLPSVVVFNPHRRLRFIKLADGVEPNEKEIRTLMEKILGGDARFTNVKGQKLPSFAARRPPPAKDEL